MEYTIPIHGIIGFPESKSDKKEYFTYNQFLMHMNNAKSADVINLDFDSVGGYCDIADKMIIDLVNSNKILTSSNSGNVCSAASKMFTIPSKENRVFYPQKGKFLIHNPWSSVEGDATEHMQAALSLAETEQIYINWYSKQTGADKNIIAGLMAENVALTNEQIEQFGFANLVDIPVHAFAKLKSDIKHMENNEVIESKFSLIEGLLTKIIATVTGDKQKEVTAKAIMIADASGNELTIDSITDISELAVGQKITVTGTLEPEYVLNDGTKLVLSAGGVIEEIILPQEDGEGDGSGETEVEIKVSLTQEEADSIIAENESLKMENEALKLELESLKGTTEQTAVQITELNSELVNLKALASGTKAQINTPSTASVDSNINVAKSFSWKLKEK